MCIYNQMIKNRKYTKNKKNQGNIPSLPDRRVEYVPTKCGNCIECRKQKAREWKVRLMEDIKTNTNGKFITLTFSNDSISHLIQETIKKTDKQSGTIQKISIRDLKGYDRDNAIATKSIRMFNERWRKKYKKAVRHWLITELGHNGTENIHMHGIIWTNETYDTIREIWGNGKPYIHPITKQQLCHGGFVWPSPKTRIKPYVNNRTISYMTKYVNKVDKKHKEYKPIILTSPGIGANYINTRAAEKNMITQNETYRTTTGHEIALPIYWRNQLFTDQDREELWIKKLNKEERWVDGIRYDISKTDKHYKRAVQQARQKNIQLGYGTRPNENRKQYEEQIREIMYETRLKKTQN